MTEYIFTYQKIWSIIDPMYVIVNLTSNRNHSLGNVNVNSPSTSPHVAVVFYLKSNHVFTFNSSGVTDDAQHLIVWLQGTNLKLKVFAFQIVYSNVLY